MGRAPELPTNAPGWHPGRLSKQGHGRAGKLQRIVENELPRTVLGWGVQDIEAVVAWLQKRGVEFEKYPFVQDKERGIWAAPGGNVLSVAQHKPQT